MAEDLLWSFMTLSILVLTRADYSCVCSYNALVPVYRGISTTAQTYGFLNYLDCKQHLTEYSTDNWRCIAFEHKVGYVETKNGVLLQTCNGYPPNGDIIPVTATSSTTSSQSQTTIPHYNTATKLQSSSAAQITTTVGFPNPDGDVSRCPYSMTHAARQYNAAVGQFQHKCYAVGVGNMLAWHHAESFCSQFNGHLVHIENSAEQSFVTNFVWRHSYGKPIWLGYNDRAHEGHYEWTYGGASPYTNWASGHPSRFGHEYDDCVKLDPSRYGQWYDATCGQQWFFHDKGETHEVMCQYDLLSYPAIVG